MRVNDEELFVVDYKEDDSKKILYAPLRSYLGLAKLSVIESITSNDNSEVCHFFFQKLRNRPLLNMDEIINKLHDTNPELSLAISDNCNLRCHYCHASAGEKHKKATMDYNVIDSVLLNYFNYIKKTKNVKINFNGGGEPTYDLDKLKYSIEKANSIAKENGITCHYIMATNGFYGNKTRQFVVDNFSHISLSFDGPKHIHDLHRPSVGGNGSFATVNETARYFLNAKIPFAFRATISKYSMRYMEEIIDFFADEFPNTSVGLEHLNLLGRAEHCKIAEVCPPDKALFSEKLIDILKYIKNKPIKIINSASTEFNLVRPIFCSNVGIPNWTVTTKGNLMACSRDNAPKEFTFGKFDFSKQCIELDYNKINNLKNMVVTNYHECVDCFCKYHCAGDCPDRRLTDKSDCTSIQKVGKHILNTILSNNKEFNYAHTISYPRNN